MIQGSLSILNRGTLLVAAALLLPACNKSDDTANLTLALADTPTDLATSVVVTIAGVELRDGGNVPTLYRFASPKQVDLLQEQAGNNAVLLNAVDLNAGDYQSVRLLVDLSHSHISLFDGSVHPLVIPPGGDPSGFTVASDFSVASGSLVKLTVDVNLRESIVQSSGKFLFQPVLRLVDDANVGQISGIVAPTLKIGADSIATPSCAATAYIYAGQHVSPVDIDLSQAVQPYTTASLKLDTVTGNYVYTAAFLTPRGYTVALTCAADDNPSFADTLSFYTPRSVTVTNGMTTQVNFP